MKILVFTSQFYQLGGYERLSIELAQNLNRLGVHTDILSQYTYDLPGVSIADAQIKASGVPDILYLGLSVKSSILSLPGAIIRFRKLAIYNQYDAVEVSGFTPCLIASLATIGLRSKVLIGVHRNYLRSRHSGLKNFLWRQVLRSRRYTKFYAISQSVARDWISFTKTEPRRTTVVFNSVNEKYFHVHYSAQARDKFREQLGADSNSKLILFVGRLLRSKGIDTLFDALKPILERDNLHLIYVGRADDCESPDDAILLQNLMADINCASWGHRVNFLGERFDVHEIMASCDLLVHPARHEGFGLILAEALAVGLPIVASNVGGIPEVLAGTEGLLVPPDHPAVLAEAIKSVLNWSQDRTEKAIQEGKRRAEDFRGITRAKKMLDLF